MSFETITWHLWASEIRFFRLSKQPNCGWWWKIAASGLSMHYPVVQSILHHTSCSIRGALVLKYSIGDALRGKMMSWMKRQTIVALWMFKKAGEDNKQRVYHYNHEGDAVYCTFGKAFPKAEENCAVVAICHSYYINSAVYLSWRFRSWSNVPIVFMTWKFTRDKNKSWQVVSCGPGPTSTSLEHSIWWLQAHCVMLCLCCLAKWEGWVTSHHELGLYMFMYVVFFKSCYKAL